MLLAESNAIREVGRRIGAAFEAAVDLLLRTKGKVILSGVGKSGIVARKIAATLSSTGTPAIYLHPVDCLHGDLGALSSKDVALLLSRGGKSDELLQLIPNFRRFQVPMIGVMASRRSDLGKACDVVLEMGNIQEACPFNLAPTSTTTAMMALGDALAIVLLRKKGFRREDFAVLHQAGALGRRLQLRVSDLMYTDRQLPKVLPSQALQEAILTMTSKNLGMTTVVDTKGRLLGVLTDGDLRRAFQKRKSPLSSPVSSVMSAKPKTVGPDTLAAHALALMEEHEITTLVCVSAGKRVEGVVHIHDIVKAGVV